MKKINELVNQQYILEEKQGRKRLCYLTEKGRQRLLDAALNTVNESLKTVEESTSKLLAEKARLEEWRRASFEAVTGVEITGDMPIEERIQNVDAAVKQTIGRLAEAYKNMHRLLCEGMEGYQKMKQFSPQLDPSQFFIGFPDGRLRLIHASLLKEKDF